MAHSYLRKNFAKYETWANPRTSGAQVVLAHYVGDDDTVANIATALAASADAAELLPKGSIVIITSLNAGNLATTIYMVSANTGSALTLVASGTVLVGSRTINAQSGTTYTLVLADWMATVIVTNASAIAVTIPTNASVPFAIGTEVEIVQGGAGAITVSGATSSGVLTTAGAGQAVRLLKTATDTWIGRR